MKKIYVVLGVLAAGVLAAYLAMDSEPQIDESKKQVIASFFPAHFFAQAVGGEFVQVHNMTPAGVEPHDYEPTARDIARLKSSDLLIINGSGMEPWADNIQEVVGSNLEIVVLSEGLATLEALGHGHHEEDEEHEDEVDEDEEHEEEYDPHVWLSPLLAKQQVGLILEAFVRLDAENRVSYEKNAAELTKKLEGLDLTFKNGLKSCEQNKIITSHAAFAYLADAYGLEQVAITGISPDEEPSLQELAELAEFAKRENIRYIFFEALVSPKLAETLAREVGAKTLILDPLESGTDYFAQMYANLENLKIALACQT